MDFFSIGGGAIGNPNDRGEVKSASDNVLMRHAAPSIAMRNFADMDGFMPFKSQGLMGSL